MDNSQQETQEAQKALPENVVLFPKDQIKRKPERLVAPASGYQLPDMMTVDEFLLKNSEYNFKHLIIVGVIEDSPKLFVASNMRDTVYLNYLLDAAKHRILHNGNV